MNNLAEWLTAIGTIAVAVVAVFQDRIRRWVMSPALELSVRVKPPECHKTSWMTRTHALPCYYFRLSVTNTGKDAASRVEVFARRLERRRPDGSFEGESRFTPMNLMWAHIRRPFVESLSPGIPKICDLAHVIEPQHRKKLGHELVGVPDQKAILAFDLEVEPAMKGHLIEPGIYRLSVTLAAANAPRREYTLEINFPGVWYDDETKMLQDGFGMRLVH